MSAGSAGSVVAQDRSQNRILRHTRFSGPGKGFFRAPGVLSGSENMKIKTNGIERITPSRAMARGSHEPLARCDLSSDEQAAVLRRNFKVLALRYARPCTKRRTRRRIHARHDGLRRARTPAGLGVERCHWWAFDGGHDRPDFRAEFPGMFASMVLGRHHQPLRAPRPCRLQGRIKTAAGQGMEALVETTLQRWFYPTASARPIPEVVARSRRDDPRDARPGLRRLLPRDSRINLTQRLKEFEVSARSLVIVLSAAGRRHPESDGARDPTPRLPGSDLVLIPSGGLHLSKSRAARGVHRALATFLNKRR